MAALQLRQRCGSCAAAMASRHGLNSYSSASRRHTPLALPAAWRLLVCAALLLASSTTPTAAALRIGFATYEPEKLMGTSGVGLGGVASHLLHGDGGGAARGHSGHLLGQPGMLAHGARMHDVILAEGQAAVDVADFAEREGRPVIRFAARDEDVHPAFEFPTLMLQTARQCAPPPGSDDAAPWIHTTGPVSTAEAAIAALQTAAANAIDYSAAHPECAEVPPHTMREVPRLRFRGLEDLPLLLGRIVEAHANATTCRRLPLAHQLGVEKQAAQAVRPLPLGLVMIVKNEADFIAETLLSIKPHIDFWTIVDTGSTDATKQIVNGTMEGVPGQLLDSEFVDFAQARNVAFRAHGQRTAYVVVVDGDHTLDEAWRMRTAAARLVRECAHRSVTACSQGFTITKTYGTSSHLWLRGFPTSGIGTEQGWHFIYPIHEVPENKLTLYQAHVYGATGRTGLSLRVVTEAFINAAGHRSFAKSRLRWENNDLPLLRRLRQETPDDSRIAFYLAQTLMAIGRHQEAFEAYDERIAMGGWHEEIYESRLKQALCDQAVGRSPVASLEEAHGAMPWRAEPLHEIAKWHDAQVANCSGVAACEAGHHLLAYLHAKQAMALPLPQNDMQFVDKAVYGPSGGAADTVATHAWHVARATRDAFETGLAAAKHMAQAHSDPRHSTTVEWYHKLQAGKI